MQQVTVYSISELSETVQERAHREHLARGFEYAWLDEGIKSIKAFCHQFGIMLTEYTLSTWDHSYIKTNAENHHFRNIGKAFKLAEFPTGYCVDEDLRETFNSTFAAIGSAKWAFDVAIESAVKSIVADMEYQETLEYFIEHAAANEYQFLENGRII
jgi:hypothetical protein